MGHRTRVFALSLMGFAALLAVGLTGCTREKPAPTALPDWVPVTPTFVPTPAGAGTTISVEQTPSAAAPAATAVLEATTAPADVAPAATVVLPTPSDPEPEAPQTAFVYEVDPGDTLFSIAERYGTTVAVLVELNGLASGDSIYVGQKLQIPGSAPAGGTTDVPSSGVHVVQAGETLFSIAQRYGITTAELMAANDITNPDRIYVGQQLTIPGGDTPAVEEEEPTYHVVQQGETLLDIAVQYGLSIADLLEANDITNPDQIYVGQQLVIP